MIKEEPWNVDDDICPFLLLNKLAAVASWPNFWTKIEEASADNVV